MMTVSILQAILAALLIFAGALYLGWRMAWTVASQMSENLANEAWEKVEAERNDPVKIAAKNWIPFSKRCHACNGSGRSKA